MTWVPLLLADRSACLRYLALRELLRRRQNDAELRELAKLREGDPLVAELIALQSPSGYWNRGDLVQAGQDVQLRATTLALCRLGYLDLGPDYPAVRRGAEFLFSVQRKDGSWPRSGSPDGAERETYDWLPLQTALPLRALALCGYAADARSERGYEWLLARRLPDGAWPTGLAKGNYGYVAGYRRIPHSRWGCRSNTTAALYCLALHPARRSAPEARQALDLLLGRETREEWALGFDVARLIGAEETRGFMTFFARFDLALLLDLCRRIGAGPDDERVADLVAFVQKLRGPYGLWEYGKKPQVSRWLTFDLLRSLSNLSGEQEWQSLEPRTPLQAYPRWSRRH